MYGHADPQIRTTADGETVGPKMHAAVRLAAEEGPFPSMNALAQRVGPNASQKYGYRIVKRCQRKGLLSRPDPDHEDANPHGRGAILLTEKGSQYLDRHADDDETPSFDLPTDTFDEPVACPACGGDAFASFYSEEVEYGRPVNTNTRGAVAPRYRSKTVTFGEWKCPDCGTHDKEQAPLPPRDA